MQKWKINKLTHKPNINAKRRFDESYKSMEDSLREEPHIFRNIPFNKTQAKNILKKSISETFSLGL